MGTPQNTVHFNMLDLHERLCTLSQCHHFGHKNSSCQIQSTMGTPQTWSQINMLDLHQTLRTLSQCHHILLTKIAHVKCKTQWAHHKTWCHFKLKHRTAGRG